MFGVRGGVAGEDAVADAVGASAGAAVAGAGGGLWEDGFGGDSEAGDFGAGGVRAGVPAGCGWVSSGVGDCGDGDWERGDCGGVSFSSP